jgi:hypothetical protein
MRHYILPLTTSLALLGCARTVEEVRTDPRGHTDALTECRLSSEWEEMNSPPADREAYLNLLASSESATSPGPGSHEHWLQSASGRILLCRTHKNVCNSYDTVEIERSDLKRTIVLASTCMI